MCGKCIKDGNYPLVENLRTFEKENVPTVRERLSRLAKVNPEKMEKLELGKKDEFKEIIEKNYVFRENPEIKQKLMHNFHWIVMRGRKLKHLTQDQLAKEIREPEVVIKKIEAGFAPEKIETIRRLEDFLKIRIISDKGREEIGKHKMERFDRKDFDNLTIHDLYQMKKQREAESLKGEFEEDFDGEK